MNGIAFRAAPYAGYNWQIGPHWLLGIEGDVGFANRTTTLGGFPFSPGFGIFSDGGADGLAVKTTWDASLRGRAGYLVTPTSLVYLTGGAAWQHYDVTSTCASIECTVDFGFLPPLVITNSFTRPGWTVGGGFETALSGNWFMRADYRFADFGASRVTLSPRLDICRCKSDDRRVRPDHAHAHGDTRARLQVRLDDDPLRRGRHAAAGKASPDMSSALVAEGYRM